MMAPGDVCQSMKGVPLVYGACSMLCVVLYGQPEPVLSVTRVCCGFARFVAATATRS
eukprot:m.166391 g.166391  ORF g.166391 m.166391 type:complete len:57 (-) comp17752_c2_seq2:184-354(-)